MAKPNFSSVAFPARILELLIASSLAVIPLACMTGEDEKESKPVIESRMSVLSIDRNAKIIRFESREWDCEVNPPISTPDTEKTYYEITEGKLWIWSDSVCEAIGYSGTSTDIVGHWQNRGPTLTKPAPHAPAFCSIDPKQYHYTFMKDQVTDITVTEKEMMSTTSGTLCSAEFSMFGLLGYDADTASEFKITSKNCDVATATRRSDNKVATFTSQYSEGSSNITVQFNGKTCSQIEILNFNPNAEHCKADSINGAAAQKFHQCASAAGLFVNEWDDTLDKREAF